MSDSHKSTKRLSKNIFFCPLALSCHCKQTNGSVFCSTVTKRVTGPVKWTARLVCSVLSLSPVATQEQTTYSLSLQRVALWCEENWEAYRCVFFFIVIRNPDFVFCKIIPKFRGKKGWWFEEVRRVPWPNQAFTLRWFRFQGFAYPCGVVAFLAVLNVIWPSPPKPYCPEDA